MFILWVVYQIEVALVYLDITQTPLKQRKLVFIKYKWLKWFPHISLYNTFRVSWASQFFA